MFNRTDTMHWCRTAVLVVFLAISIAGVGPSFADEGTAAPLPSSEPEVQKSFIEERFAAFCRTVDDCHEFLQQGILQQAIRLDDFFGDVRTEDLRRTKYELRWRQSLRVEERGRLRYGTSARANIRLSRINNRLRLAISGESQAEPFAPSLPEDPGSPGLDRTSEGARLVNTELRYSLINTPDLNLFAGAGVRITILPEVFVRSRLQFTHSFNEIFLIRVGETFFVKSSDLLGETTEIDLERLLAPKTLLRWASTGTASEEIEGLEWGSELSLSHEFSPKSAFMLLGGVYGNTNFSPLTQNFRLLTRYRRNFFREWLYYELEPEISWPRNLNGGYDTAFAVTVRLEIVFRGMAVER